MVENPSPVKILIIDDHPAVREALIARIARHPDLIVCGEAGDVADAMRIVSEKAPDLIITDISLRQGNGIDLIKRVKARDEKARVLVWSMHSESLYAERALRAGAMGYITKDQPTEQIIEAIRKILAGRVYLSQAMSEKLLRRTVDGVKSTDHAPIDDLTDRELEVYRLIGQGTKTQEIAIRLHVSVKTVETYRDRIKKKLDLKDGTDLIHRAVLWVTANE